MNLEKELDSMETTIIEDFGTKNMRKYTIPRVSIKARQRRVFWRKNKVALTFAFMLGLDLGVIISILILK